MLLRGDLTLNFDLRVDCRSIDLVLGLKHVRTIIHEPVITHVSGFRWWSSLSGFRRWSSLSGLGG